MNIIGVKPNCGNTVYKVELKRGENMPDDELITRCDNRTINLSQPAGKVCHFGGVVSQQSITDDGGIFTVKVWID